jgi:hypothetical protein
MGNNVLVNSNCYIFCILYDSAVLFTIRLGSTNLNSNNNPNMLLLSTETYFLHPDYDPTILTNDIGLIKLRMQISFTGIILQYYVKIKQMTNKKF